MLLGLVVAAAVLALVWALGGFGVRSDLRVPTAAKQVISTGPYEFTFDRVTAQRVSRFDDEVYVEVKVLGTGRTTGDQAVAPTSLDAMFAAKDDASGEIHEPTGQRFGPDAAIVDGSHFTPGLPPVDYQVVFEFSEGFRPGKVLRVAVSELEFTDTSLLGTGEKTWNPGDRNFVLLLPVTTLPDRL